MGQLKLKVKRLITAFPLKGPSRLLDLGISQKDRPKLFYTALFLKDAAQLTLFALDLTTPKTVLLALLMYGL